jgi:hypothetical protein
MHILRALNSTSNSFRATLRSSATGQGLTGLTIASSGLIISTICDNEATATAYTGASSNLETISTLGTWAAPSSGKCRFKEVDATNHPGLYEIQLANARFAVSSARVLRVAISGAANLLMKEVVIQLTSMDVDTAAVTLPTIPNDWITAAGVASDVGTEIGTAVGNRIDAVVSSLATAANLAAVKAKTDMLTFTVANQVDSNVVSPSFSLFG